MTDSPSHTIYRWGRWRWYYRGLALVTYATSALALIGFGDIIRDLLREPSATDWLLIGLIALLLATCALWCWHTARQGQIRAARIDVSADGHTLTIATLNGTTRHVAVRSIRRIEYETMQEYATPEHIGDPRVYEPTLTVEIDGALPIRIDMQGQIPDPAAFRAILPYDTAKPRRRTRKSGRGRTVPQK